MDKKKKIITVVSILLIVFIAGGVVLYERLTQDYRSLASDRVIAFDHEEMGRENDNAPDITVVDGKGKKTSLSDMIGKTVVLNFWASWCGPCQYELPAFDNVFTSEDDSVVFMMVNATDGVRETIGTAKSFLSENSYKLPFYFDEGGEAFMTYGLYSLPGTFFITDDGRIAAYSIGAIEEADIRLGIEMARVKSR